jgi:hypothetical protein
VSGKKNHPKIPPRLLEPMSGAVALQLAKDTKIIPKMRISHECKTAPKGLIIHFNCTAIIAAPISAS